jgi:predicted metal-dependent enzyme (double-stranded beta helix superfamily)
MLALEFPGCTKMVEKLDDAVARNSTVEITDALRRTLCDMIRSQDVRLPDSIFAACKDHYARREIYNSEKLGYSVIAMTWGPGQGTPIHDHSGLWCVEGVWQGALEITQYELAEQSAERFKFVPVGSIQAGTGSAGSLIPPHEYHTIRNPASDQVAVSLHIYKAQMTCCSVFKPVGNDWYERGTRQLGLD